MQSFGRLNVAKKILMGLALIVMAIVAAPRLHGQAASGLSGTVTDSSGRLVTNAVVTLTNVDTKVALTAKTSGSGVYSFPNLNEGNYRLEVSAPGFKTLEQEGITLELNQKVRQDLKLQVGGADQKIEVTAESLIDRDDSTLQASVSSAAIIELPLEVSGAARSASDFTGLMPGVSGPGGTVGDSSINGGLIGGTESAIDGVSLQEGGENQSGLTALGDNKVTPDMVTQLQVVTSNYEAQYGNTASAVILEDFRSGTKQFHGALWEYARNTAFDANQWLGAPPPAGFRQGEDNQHDFGGRIGGPVPVPILTSNYSKTFFFFLLERYRAVGGVNRPTLSLPTLAERTGDFRDWGEPVYDPATTVISADANGNLVVQRQQFMGCDGHTPNVICATDPRLVNAYANSFIKYLPTPTNSATTNNYLVPKAVPNGAQGLPANYYLYKIDNYLGEKEHFSGAVYHNVTLPTGTALLPVQIDNGTNRVDTYAWIVRAQWDHTFSSTLLNHFAFGYQNTNSSQESNNYKYASSFPTIAGTFDPTSQVPQIGIEDFTGYSSNTGKPVSPAGRPAYIYNDLFTWVKGNHTFKFGGEFRWAANDQGESGNQAGSFNFIKKTTSATANPGGNAFASFLLGEVDNASFTAYKVPAVFTRQYYYTAFAGDTWKASPKLSVTYGLRYDVDTPTIEKNNNSSFFDPTGPNSGAGGLLGREAWAGHKWPGDAAYGKRYPEALFWKAFSPRLGLAYTVDEKTVVRAGYGIFYNQLFYQGWGGGNAIDGLNPQSNAYDTESGYVPAFNIANGFPAADVTPQIVSSTNSNGHGIPNYRDPKGGQMGYTQQWNLTIERQVAPDTTAGLSYVGNKGTHLVSQISAINDLNPSYLNTLGSAALEATFAPGQATLNGVSAPYAGWAAQLGGHATVAQALLQYPQYQGHTEAVNENQGINSYHSLQAKVDKKFSHGLYALANYTWSKNMTNTGFVQETYNTWNGSGLSASISPFEKSRNYALANSDITHIFHAGYSYELPIGRGKLLNISNPVLSSLVGGWKTSGIAKLNSGTPLHFQSSKCNVPSELGIGCIPGLIPGVRPFLQDKNHFDPSKPILNSAAFEGGAGSTEADIFSNSSTYFGRGQRFSNLRGSDYKDFDAGLWKIFTIRERYSFQVRADLFNAFNNHYFQPDSVTGTSPFNNDVGQTNFGTWTRAVTNPRQLQLSGRFDF